MKKFKKLWITLALLCGAALLAGGTYWAWRYNYDSPKREWADRLPALKAEARERGLPTDLESLEDWLPKGPEDENAAHVLSEIAELQTRIRDEHYEQYHETVEQYRAGDPFYDVRRVQFLAEVGAKEEMDRLVDRLAETTFVRVPGAAEEHLYLGDLSMNSNSGVKLLTSYASYAAYTGEPERATRYLAQAARLTGYTADLPGGMYQLVANRSNYKVARYAINAAEMLEPKDAVAMLETLVPLLEKMFRYENSFAINALAMEIEMEMDAEIGYISPRQIQEARLAAFGLSSEEDVPVVEELGIRVQEHLAQVHFNILDPVDRRAQAARHWDLILRTLDALEEKPWNEVKQQFSLKGPEPEFEDALLYQAATPWEEPLVDETVEYVIESLERAQESPNALRIGIEIFRHKEAHGELPEALPPSAQSITEKEVHYEKIPGGFFFSINTDGASATTLENREGSDIWILAQPFEQEDSPY